MYVDAVWTDKAIQELETKLATLTAENGKLKAELVAMKEVQQYHNTEKQHAIALRHDVTARLSKYTAQGAIPTYSDSEWHMVLEIKDKLGLLRSLLFYHEVESGKATRKILAKIHGLTQERVGQLVIQGRIYSRKLGAGIK